ncbi:U2 small nuclear ribonucleoprotein auxiliary factor 35 kDa subunit-related protein 2 [Culicoides brevitarsis]|uniref:U2 small nuclear ribonucleoprotein auxiliary factor 35 kDa subunit-related protein 2 n=1 Tax=Culicoides brevitarsis TaxID=469753 RepID=UPI00307B917F
MIKNHPADCDITEVSSKKSRLPRKIYRKLLKKAQRRRKRQKLAQKRDEEQKLLEADPLFQQKQREKLALDLAREESERESRRIQEEKWLETEKMFQSKIAEARKRQEEFNQRQMELLREEERRRAALRKEKEDRERREQLAFETYQQQIESYTTGIREEIPDLLQNAAQTNPGRETCGFFLKTSVCRYGDACVKNHIKPGISKILLIRNFFTHIRLDQAPNTEYGGDLHFEYEDGELQKAYDDFYYDTVHEIEKFGEIENFVTAKQAAPHFRGNVWVEFKDQRDALRAFQGLIGRFYGGKQLTIEFSGIPNFVQALCGKSFRKCCNQGSNCNFIHMFKNPGVRHKIDAFWLQMQWEMLKKKQRTSERTEISTWDEPEDKNAEKRHWRWSESPERRTKNTEVESPPKKRPTKDKETRDKHHKHKKSRYK